MDTVTFFHKTRSRKTRRQLSMTQNRKAFTLVEILIVVIILGILAAIVIPQFTEASNDARESALSSDLQTVRSQLELYKVQHLDTYPTAASLVTKLTSRTNAQGTVMGDGDDAADFPYGPYLQKFPSNPFVSGTASQTVNTGATAVAGDGTSGWYWDTTLTKFSPNDGPTNSHKDL
ncbi:MAG TPA: hypothetical protein DCX07_05980 [Phycisphaerales bacterium]|nr:hypothetical protein [Phycisphaerales bacterium]